MVAMMRFKYLLVIVLLLGAVAVTLLECLPRISEWTPFVGGTFIVIVLTLSALVSQKWAVLVASMKIWINGASTEAVPFVRTRRGSRLRSL
jgi:hypothetical protein